MLPDVDIKINLRYHIAGNKQYFFIIL